MAYKIQLEGELLVMRFYDGVDSEDLRQSVIEVEEIEHRREIAPDRITDLSEADLAKWSYEVVEELAERRRRARLKNDVQSAIFAPSDLQFGYSRMFQMLNDNPRIAVQVFRDCSKAMRWLQEGNCASEPEATM